MAQNREPENLFRELEAINRIMLLALKTIVNYSQEAYSEGNPVLHSFSLGKCAGVADQALKLVEDQKQKNEKY